MKVKQAMHKGVDWCAPDTKLQEIAKLMRKDDVGAIPIGENDRLVGMLTDRDIVIRGLADGKDLAKLTARDVMSPGIVFCTEDEDLDDAIHLMEQKKLRRLPVINAKKRMVGMLSLGDLSHAANHEMSGELLGEVASHHH